MNLTIHFFFLLLFLILSALFSSSESAIFSLTEYERSKFKSRHLSAYQRLSSFLKDSTKTISLIITGNTIVNIVATSIMGVLLYYFFPQISVILSIFIVTSIILFFGEVVPKLLALRFASSFSFFSVYFLTLISKVIFPLESFFSRAAIKVSLLFFSENVGALEDKPALSEIYAMVKSGEERGLLDKEERVLAERVLDLGKSWAREIMTPRIDMEALEEKSSLDELKELIRETKHTRYIIYRESLDSVAGVIYSRDFLFSKFSIWNDLVRPVLTVPDSMDIDELLIQFKERNEEIALIVDEYGGTAGIVTLEDILEELVGEIENEYKRDKNKIKKIDLDTYTVMANVSLSDLSDELDVDLKTPGISSLGGLLLNLFQKVPSSGQSIEYKDLKFFIDEVSRNRIKKVTIKISR
ncbi:MAG: hemolysin family protein [Candidatus Kaelpia aquatica]|nr:hemolysin family protein [Candidatus Kaelpia aquatica]